MHIYVYSMYVYIYVYEKVRLSPLHHRVTKLSVKKLVTPT